MPDIMPLPAGLTDIECYLRAFGNINSLLSCTIVHCFCVLSWPQVNKIIIINFIRTRLYHSAHLIRAGILRNSNDINPSTSLARWLVSVREVIIRF